MIVLLIISILLNIFFVIQCVLISRKYDDYNARFKAELEDIKAEITRNRDEWIKGQDAEWHTYDRCLAILDKHIKENK